MYGYLLQDWLTVRGASAITVFNQPENAWLDLAPFQDVMAWLEVKEVTPTSGALQVSYQTAPAKEDALFTGMTAAIAVTGPGVTTTVMRKLSSAVPLARWVRWQVSLTSAAAWDITFRIYLACNALGSNRARVMQQL